MIILIFALLLIDSAIAFSFKNWLTGFIAYDLETQKCEDQNSVCKKDCLTPYTSCLRTCDAKTTSVPDSCLISCNTQSTSCSTTCRQTHASCVESVRAGTTRMTLTICDQNARACSNTCAQSKTSCTVSCNSEFNLTACKDVCTQTENKCNQNNKICDDQLLTCKQQVEQQYPPKDCSLENMKHNEFKCKTTRILQQCIDGTLINIPCENGCNSVQNICNAPIVPRSIIPSNQSKSSTRAEVPQRTLPSEIQTSSTATQPTTTRTEPLVTRQLSITQQENLKKRIDQLLESKQAGRITDEEFDQEIKSKTQSSEEICSVMTDYTPDDPCYQQVIAQDDVCCTGEQGWDNFCENSYAACADPESFNNKVCQGTSPYNNQNGCYIETIKLDVMCCDEGWDEFCQEEYDALLQNGDCEVPEELDDDIKDDDFEYDEEDFTVPDVFGFDVDINSEFEDNLEVERIREDFEFDPEAEGIDFGDELEQQASDQLAEEIILEELKQASPESLEEQEELEIQKRLANNRFVVLKTEGDNNIRLGRNQHRILEKGTSLAQGSRLQTGTLGIIILATNELKIRAEPASKIEIKKIKQKKTIKELEISLEYGLIKMNKNKDALSKVIVETPNAIIEVNGGVEISYNQNDTTTNVKVADGSALVKSKVESQVTEVFKNTETNVEGTPNILLRFAYFIKG